MEDLLLQALAVMHHSNEDDFTSSAKTSLGSNWEGWAAQSGDASSKAVFLEGEELGPLRLGGASDFIEIPSLPSPERLIFVRRPFLKGIPIFFLWGDPRLPFLYKKSSSEVPERGVFGEEENCPEDGHVERKRGCAKEKVGRGCLQKGGFCHCGFMKVCFEWVQLRHGQGQGASF